MTFDVRLDELLRKKARLANTTLGDSPLTEMLNGSGPDVSLMDLVVDSGQGKAFESRPLTMDDIDRLDGFGFEVLCKMLWEKSGYLAKVTPKKRGDGGIDVYAVMGKEGELLQCKSSKGADVGWDAIKEVVGGAAMLQRYFPGVEFRRVVVTNQNFNGRAREQAVVNGVRTVERADLEGMLLKWPIKNTELDADIEASGILFESEWTS